MKTQKTSSPWLVLSFLFFILAMLAPQTFSLRGPLGQLQHWWHSLARQESPAPVMSHRGDKACSSSGPSISLQPNHQLFFLPLSLPFFPGGRSMALLLTSSAFARILQGVDSSRPWAWRILGRLEDHWYTLCWEYTDGMESESKDAAR